MVTTRTGSTYSAASSSKPRSKNVRFVDTQLQPGTCDPPTEDDVNSNSSMHLPQDSASLVHDSARCPLAALIAQEPVEPGLEENGDSRQTLHADLLCEVQAAEPTLQGTQSTEPGSQGSDAGLAKSRPGEHPDMVASPCEDMHAGLISEIITAGAAPREEGPTNCDPRDIQPTDVTTQQPELSDLAPREPVGCHGPQETNSVSLARCETEIEIVDLTGCQEPEAASLAPHETAPQVPETADPLQEPQAALSAPQDSRRSNSEEAGHSRVLARLMIDGNNGHSPTDTGPALGSPGDTNENPIVLDDSSAGDSRYNPIEIPADPITQRSRTRKRKRDEDIGAGLEADAEAAAIAVGSGWLEDAMITDTTPDANAIPSTRTPASSADSDIMDEDPEWPELNNSISSRDLLKTTLLSVRDDDDGTLRDKWKCFLANTDTRFA